MTFPPGIAIPQPDDSAMLAEMERLLAVGAAKLQIKRQTLKRLVDLARKASK